LLNFSVSSSTFQILNRDYWEKLRVGFKIDSSMSMDSAKDSNTFANEKELDYYITYASLVDLKAYTSQSLEHNNI
jgi:hypothetical protein